MSRHRDVRNMDYSDDYDGYDDVYGHSVDDDYYISPSHRQFLYNRENAGQSRSCDAHSMEQDIQEEDEIDEETMLSEADRHKLEICLEYVKTVLSPLTMARQEIVRIIVENRFEADKVLNAILNTQSTHPLEKREKGDTIFNNNVGHLKTFHSNGIDNATNELPATLQSLSLKTDLSNKFLSKTILEKQQAVPSRKFTNFSRNSKKTCTNHPGRDIVDFPSMKRKELRQFHRSKTNYSEIEAELNDDTNPRSIPLIFTSKIGKLNGGNEVDDSCILPHASPSSTNPRFKACIFSNGFSEGRAVDSFISKITKPHSNINSDFIGNSNQTELEVVSPGVNKFLTGIFKSSSKLHNGETHLSEGLIRLKVTKSTPTLPEHLNVIDCNLDLTKTLRRNNSELFQAIKFETQSRKENFELPFVACDQDELSGDKKQNILDCTLDISHLANLRNPHRKRPSQLGRILCSKYKISTFKRIRKKGNEEIMDRFSFSTFSPDDLLRKHLRLNL